MCREQGIDVHERGTIVIINGPRFSTKSESKWFSDAGWEAISMTQYPEAYLCRELGMAVVNIALITDYDAGVIEGTEAVDARSVLEVFAQNAERIQKVVLEMIGRFPADLDALGARRRSSTPGRRPRDVARGHPPVRDGAVGVVRDAVPAPPGAERDPAVLDRDRPPRDPRGTRLVARERGSPGRGRLCRTVVLGSLHGPGDLTVPVVESWTILAMAAARTSA